MTASKTRPLKYQHILPDAILAKWAHGVMFKPGCYARLMKRVPARQLYHLSGHWLQTYHALRPVTCNCGQKP